MSFHSVSKMSRKGAPLADFLEAASSAGAAAPAAADAATPSVLRDEPINRRRLFVIQRLLPSPPRASIARQCRFMRLFSLSDYILRPVVLSMRSGPPIVLTNIGTEWHTTAELSLPSDTMGTNKVSLFREER